MFGSTANFTKSLTMNLLWNINRIIASEQGNLRSFKIGFNENEVRVLCVCLVYIHMIFNSWRQLLLMSVINLFIYLSPLWFRSHYANSVDCQWISSKNLFISTTKIVGFDSISILCCLHKGQPFKNTISIFYLFIYFCRLF